MARSEALGLRGIHAVHFYVNDLSRGRSFWVDTLDFAFIAESGEGAEGAKSEAYRAGDATYIYSAPTSDDSPVAKFLSRHPDGIAELIFEVEDVKKTFQVLEERGAAIVGDIETATDDGGTYRSFSITTPFGEALFTFAQIDGFAGVAPGLTTFAEPKGGNNAFGFGEIDHVTSNFLTLKPLILWCKDVLGLEEYWGIEFHTQDYAKSQGHTGSGLKSTVVWDPHSGVKFANNEPNRPFFAKSQIYTYIEDNNGPGIQHTALTIADIVGTVDTMRERGIQFMPTPGSYYDMLPKRLDAAGIELDEPMDDLRRTEILVDGEGPGKYLLQIFCKDFATIYDNPNGGPFFLEIIQRKGDRGFGGGNFRALFESIEREQVATGRV